MLGDAGWREKQIRRLVDEEGWNDEAARRAVDFSATEFHDPAVRRSGNLEYHRDISPMDGYIVNPKLMWGQ